MYYSIISHHCIVYSPLNSAYTEEILKSGDTGIIKLSITPINFSKNQ